MNVVPSVFQNGGNTLCAVDDSNDHVLSVWDWQREDRLAEVKVSSIVRLRQTVTCLHTHIDWQLNCCVFVLCVMPAGSSAPTSRCWVQTSIPPTAAS